jgi:hypothetical protein
VALQRKGVKPHRFTKAMNYPVNRGESRRFASLEGARAEQKLYMTQHADEPKIRRDSWSAQRFASGLS